MCGITGFWTADHRGASAIAQRMAQQIAHRGPDDAGVWVDPAQGLALAHRRLAVVDLSPAGAQPMASRCGRYVVVFNGEIYNHLALRRDLAGPWRGHSDTETLIEAIAQWGLAATLPRVVGMFALALWDAQRRELTLVRDRFGEKPLYYGWQGPSLLFGSDLAALRQHPHWQGGVDRQALSLLLRHNYVPAPYCLHPGLRKVPPGTTLTWTWGDHGPQAGAMPEPQAYWKVRECAGQTRGTSRELFIPGSESTWVDQAQDLLAQAVAGQMVADVEVGAFLSGGIDSSLVVALMQAQSARPVRTFSIGFREAAFNEAPHAAAVARHLGTVHEEWYVDDAVAQSVIPELPHIYSEPLADASQIPTILVSRLARKQVTVSLSGDGGDELFAGYDRYARALHMAERAGAVPAWMRRMAAAFLRHIPASELRADRLRAQATAVQAGTAAAMNRVLTSHWPDPARVVLGGSEPPTVFTDTSISGSTDTIADPLDRLLWLDQRGYLPDDILAKVDRAAMSTSLETRMPLLDHRVAKFAWRMPKELLRKNGQGKYILRQVLARLVPESLTNRPKQGFAVPMAAWLRGPLRSWAEDLLAEDRLRREGYFNPAPIRQAWVEHLSGRRDHDGKLWIILSFQAWLAADKR